MSSAVDVERSVAVHVMLPARCRLAVPALEIPPVARDVDAKCQSIISSKGTSNQAGGMVKRQPEGEESAAGTSHDLCTPE